ncbi:MAG: helix-turn-helix domain-containing protein [Dactylosporangium sp.]|nr:helix-turn-helix domain-containing protein [Dactylosporangium sp.]NNJ63784.1 helix-turn-helix domain-containing protein [Dactylosporangium sp.]
MALSSPDLVLHPVRSRIVHSMLGAERRTARELTRLLPDVPQATLYRHLAALVDGNILRIVSDRHPVTSPQRGYALAEAPSSPAGHRHATVYLDDTEFAEFARHLSDLIDRAASRTAVPGRRRRLLATMAISLDSDP